MTLDRAILIYKREIAQKGIKILSTLDCQIGLEALERVRDLRGYEPQTLSKTWEKIFSKLPSETEEGK